MALNTASEEDIQAAADGTGQGMSVATYKKHMLRNAWGDNLMISGLARVFNKDISVISLRFSRIFFAAGDEANGARPDSV